MAMLNLAAFDAILNEMLADQRAEALAKFTQHNAVIRALLAKTPKVPKVIELFPDLPECLCHPKAKRIELVGVTYGQDIIKWVT